MASARTPAQWFCLVGGALLLGRGLVGFAFLDSDFSTPGEGWHHLIHLLSGLALLGAFAADAGTARFAAVAFGIGYASLAVAGIVEGDTAFGLIGADAADKAFHTVVGLASLAAGLVSRPPPAAAAAS
jgi:hypothetical protein